MREEIHHIREGKHGARSTKQAIAIGLSKARRSGSICRPLRKAPFPKRRGTARNVPTKRASEENRDRLAADRTPLNAL